MKFKNVQYILFDAANTLIYKPSLWPTMISVLMRHGHEVQIDKLKSNHKILSEATNFPDRTSREFYQGFNSELLFSLGIIPNNEILEDIFKSCSYLPWERFEDTAWLTKFKLPIGVLSNFNDSLYGLLNDLFGNIFSNIIVSETHKIRKPDIELFNKGLREVKLPAERILFVGDSLKLDIVPANQIGFDTCLIDRLDIYKNYKERVTTMVDLKALME